MAFSYERGTLVVRLCSHSGQGQHSGAQSALNRGRENGSALQPPTSRTGVHSARPDGPPSQSPSRCARRRFSIFYSHSPVAFMLGCGPWTKRPLLGQQVGPAALQVAHARRLSRCGPPGDILRVWSCRPTASGLPPGPQQQCSPALSLWQV